jgi:hemoglobin
MRHAVRPAPERDLDTPEEIAELVRRFYADVAQDELLGPVFHDVAAVDWSTHLPKLTAFWCRALLGIPGYTGNPFQAHARIHARQAFTAAHFERWLSLFHETLDLGWVGPLADRAGALADDVARVHGQQLLGRPAAPADGRRALGGQGAQGGGERADAEPVSVGFGGPDGPVAEGRGRRP